MENIKKKGLFFRIVRKALSYMPLKLKKEVVIGLGALLNVDILSIAYESMGISKYQNFYLSGEEFLLNKILPRVFKNNRITVFDVGANIGLYSLKVYKSNPKSSIYAFEPMRETYNLLLDKTKEINNIKCFNLGLGSRSEKLYLYTYKDNNISSHASLYREVISDLHGSDNNLTAFEVDLTTLDEFCIVNNIEVIDFLKIDTEGNEYFVLKGAEKLLLNNKIKVIQFEFGEMNIVSKVFLKDFFNLLNDFNIYRLDTNRLLPLFPYRSTNEIFVFQNLIAIKKEIDNF